MKISDKLNDSLFKVWREVGRQETGEGRLRMLMRLAELMAPEPLTDPMVEMLFVGSHASPKKEVARAVRSGRILPASCHRIVDGQVVTHWNYFTRQPAGTKRQERASDYFPKLVTKKNLENIKGIA